MHNGVGERTFQNNLYGMILILQTKTIEISHLQVQKRASGGQSSDLQVEALGGKQLFYFPYFCDIHNGNALLSYLNQYVYKINHWKHFPVKQLGEMKVQREILILSFTHSNIQMFPEFLLCVNKCYGHSSTGVNQSHCYHGWHKYLREQQKVNRRHVDSMSSCAVFTVRWEELWEDLEQRGDIVSLAAVLKMD